MEDSSGSCSSPLLAAGLLPLLAADSVFTGLPPVLVAVAVALVGSALASATEAAFLSLPMIRAQAMTSSDNAMVRMAGKLRIDFARPLATIVVINNIANVSGSAVAGAMATKWAANQGWEQDTAIGIFTACFTLIVILAGEIVPKTIGENNAETVARYAAYPLRGVQLALNPVVWLIGLTQKPFLGSRGHVTSEAEIAQLAALGQEQGAIEQAEGQMIHRVLKLDQITASDIMTPRVEMVALPADRRLNEISAELFNITRSLIPLYRKNRDDVVAVLDRMDALLALATRNGELRLSDPSISTKPFFVPETMPCDDLLVALQRRTDHLAVVVGEYGETVGLVTLEDVIEEIVGEIYDEEDIGEGDGIQRVSRDEVVAVGAAEVKAVNEYLGTDIPNHRTVAGLLLDELERIPVKGEHLESHGVTFLVDEANERAILRVRIKRVKTHPDVDAGAEPHGDAEAHAAR